MMICALRADIVVITNVRIFICLMKIIQCPDIFTFFIIYVDSYSIFSSFLIFSASVSLYMTTAYFLECNVLQDHYLEVWMLLNQVLV